jgi:hypothetical protein
MTSVQVTISKFVDEYQPGIVECWLEDVHGRRWRFIEKAPLVSDKDIWTDSEYLQPGAIACTVLQKTADASRRYVVTIDTSKPWAVESVDGCTVFDVLAEQLVGDTAAN